MLVVVNVADDVRRCYMCGGLDKAGHDGSDYRSVWICVFAGMVCLGTAECDKVTAYDNHIRPF